jgi:hypothetical protein
MDRNTQGHQAQELQSYTFTVRMTGQQHARFVELEAKENLSPKLSVNTWILVRLGLITKEEAATITARHGIRGRKLAQPSTSNSGDKSCKSAL